MLSSPCSAVQLPGSTGKVASNEQAGNSWEEDQKDKGCFALIVVFLVFSCCSLCVLFSFLLILFASFCLVHPCSFFVPFSSTKQHRDSSWRSVANQGRMALGATSPLRYASSMQRHGGGGIPEQRKTQASHFLSFLFCFFFNPGRSRGLVSSMPMMPRTRSKGITCILPNKNLSLSVVDQHVM